jgi:threonine dehydrogenase-like Zn-dependent dehydrogenase
LQQLRIFAIARGLPLLERLQALAPNRIKIFSNREGSTAAWVKSLTEARGADFMIDTLGAVASLDSFKDAMHGVRRGGKIVNIGGTAGELGVDVKWWMDEQMELAGSVWSTIAEGIELAGMVGSGVLDISVLQPKSWPLDEVNDAISGVSSGEGGFTSYLVEI